MQWNLNILFVLAVTGLVNGAPSPLTKRAVGDPVDTTSGRVSGHAALVAPLVSEYLGIPYAEAASGSLRWAPPKRVVRSGEVKGTKYSPDCPQPTFTLATGGSPVKERYSRAVDQTNHTFSEDCLTVNVWTKSPNTDAKKAVLVWIYGGSFSFGTSNSSFYNGAHLADLEDVVVVSLNYRVGFFGFMSPPNVKAQNYGLLDQRMAIEWVRDNIAHFGGDPSRITLFGESAGGISIDLYSYAWTKDPIVNGFIEESGAYGILTTGPLGDPKTLWYDASKAAGCGDASAGPEKTEACMRALPFQTIVTATTPAWFSTVYLPIVDDVTVFSPAKQKTKADSGDFIKRPLLGGNNNNEGGYFSAFFGYDQATVKILNDNYACKSGAAASARTKNNVKTWRYRYYGVWPNMALDSTSGAYHTSEIPMVFGTTEETMGADTPDEKKVERLMMHAWATFAKDPDNGLSTLDVPWPVYGSSGNTLVKIAENNSPGVSFGANTQFDINCGA